MIERKLNSGRSILEMLGVLAIIAVITLMGLGLIRFLINYAEAYSTIKSANETAVELRIRQGRGYLVENYWMFNANITTWEEQRVLTLTMRNTTPEDLCKAILRQAKRNTEIIHVEPANCTADNNQVVFYFAFDEGTYHSPFTGDANTDKNDPLSGGCAGKSIPNGECTYEDENCILRKDVGDSCGSGSICLPDGTDLVCRECPEELPDGYCRAWDGCDGLVDKADGDSCGGNRQCQSGECVCTLEKKDCPERYEISHSTCSCYCPLTAAHCGSVDAIDSENCLCVCDEGYTGYSCGYTCPTTTEVILGLSKSACEACGNSFWKHGICYNCGYSLDIPFATNEEAMECVNACAGTGYERYQSETVCYPYSDANCPSITSYGGYVSKTGCEMCGGDYFWNNGTCYGCGYSSRISFDTEAEAQECEESCAGSEYERFRSLSDCVPATDTSCPSITSYTLGITRSVCEDCIERDGVPRIWNSYACRGCGYSSSISFDTEAEAQNCEAICAGSEYEREAEGTTCYLKKSCPLATSSVLMSQSSCQKCIEEDGIQRIWKNGTCYGCGYSSSISFDTEAEAQECENVCANSGYERYQDGMRCYKSDTGCPSATSRSSMSKSACDKCIKDNGVKMVWCNGICAGCGNAGLLSCSDNDCENACSGSGYERYQNGTMCRKLNCPKARSSVPSMTEPACSRCDSSFLKDQTCYGCGYSSKISFDTEAEAQNCEESCAGSEYEREAEGTTCYLKKSCPLATSSVVMSQSSCQKCIEEDGIQRIWKNGTCYGCGYSSSISFDTEAEAQECENVCANSGYERYQDGKTCYLPTNEECPSLTSSVSNMSETRCKECGDSVWKDGVCYGCGYSDNILFDSENKAKECMNTCTGTKYERYQSGEYCSLAQNTELCPPSGRYVGSTSKNTCRRCGNGFYDKGACYNCDFSSISFDTEAEAEECVNSCANSGYERMAIGTYCKIANTGCPLVKSSLHDVPQPNCEKCGNTIWKYGVCYDCGYSVSISFDTEAEAQNCEAICAGSEYEREAEGTTCYLKQACPSATSNVLISQSSCQKCIEEDGIQRFWENGRCQGCGYSAALHFDTNEEAEACMNACAGTGYERYQKGTVCMKATTTSCPDITSPTSNISKSVCEKCGNTIWEDGTCYACGYSSSISFDTEAEAKACENACANSGYKRYQSGTYCALETNTECPSETSTTSLIGKMSQSSCQKCIEEDGIQRIWSGGLCHGCGTLYDISFSTETEAKACSDVCARSGYERYQDGTKCYGPKSCPTATSATSNMSKTACEACEDAIWNDGVCYGCGSPAKISFDTEEEAEVCVAICENSSYPREIDESGEDYYCGLK